MKKRRTKKRNPGCSWLELQPGCIITFKRPRHGNTVGRAIVRASKGKGWIVAVRGTAAKPTIVTRSQFISAKKGVRSNPPPLSDLKVVAKALDLKKVTPQGAAAAGYRVDAGAATVIPRSAPRPAARPAPGATTVPTNNGGLKPVVPTKGPLAKRNPSTIGYDVYLGDLRIETVFYTSGFTADEIKRSLVKSDGFDPRITVKRSAKNNPRRKKGSAYVTLVMDVNGNKVAKLVSTYGSFGIQTNQNLPGIHRHRSKGRIKSISGLNAAIKEMFNHVAKYGTKRQKAIVKKLKSS